jgi:basic membrane lipoprotein Med (substrate-binding protein (PBP1-ABC) superfamily)
VKHLRVAANSVITKYLAGDLPQGPFDIGIEKGAIALVHINDAVPTRIKAKLARVKQQNMRYWKSFATPQK